MNVSLQTCVEIKIPTQKKYLCRNNYYTIHWLQNTGNVQYCKIQMKLVLGEGL